MSFFATGAIWRLLFSYGSPGDIINTLKKRRVAYGNAIHRHRK